MVRTTNEPKGFTMNQLHSSQLTGQNFSNESIFNSQNLVFNQADLSETCKNVGQIFKPHALKVLKSAKNFSASMHHVQTGALSISRLEYGADVLIEPDQLEKFYLIQIPTRGYAEIEFGQDKFISYSEVASIISPDQSLRMRWRAHSPQLILKISKDDFAHHCQQHIVKSEQKNVIFNPRLDFTTQSGGYFLQLLRTMMDALKCEHHPLHHPLAFKQFESNLFNALIYGQPNNAFFKANSHHEKKLAPYFIKRAEAYIHNHLHEPLNIEVLAEQSGVSARTLFAGFKNHFGITPMAYLRELRFEQAHLELMNNEHATVTDVAFKWGFTHLGRFSQEYKRRYGELPSSTRKITQNSLFS